ncbi:MAG: MFS transporter [Pseudoclavibacter sp.]|nr:MFS transporter [Pseudoclavibacter sp.]
MRSRGRIGAGAAALASLLLLAACLRGGITAFGPVVDRIAAETGLGEAALGLIGTLPVAAFAIVSPFVHRPVARLGAEGVALLALAGILAGLALRLLPGVGGLAAGTLLLGAGVAVGNVLVPVLVRRDFPERIPLVTALASSVMGGFAALGAGTAAPIAEPLGWRWALAASLPLVLAAVLVWSVRALRVRPALFATEDGGAGGPPPWRSGTAWLVAAHMGLQSAGFYITTAWLPSISRAAGADAVRAGLDLFLCQLAGLLAGLAVTPIMAGRRDQRPAVLVACAPLALGAAGMLLAPGLMTLWSVVLGIGQGAGLVVALALIALRADGTRQAARLSGMTQGVGYALAALGPVLAGAAHEHGGSWAPVLLGLLGLSAAQAAIGWACGRDRVAEGPGFDRG